MATVEDVQAIQNRVHLARHALKKTGRRLTAAQRELRRATNAYDKEQARLQNALGDLKWLGVSLRQSSFEVDEHGWVLSRKAHVK